ncbi:MAG: hypothetical protein ACJ8F3_11135 [Xanthobacteraceae bacterium]
MDRRAEKAWSTAAYCSERAQATADMAEREFFIRMRNAWIAVANQSQFHQASQREQESELLPGIGRTDPAGPVPHLPAA